MASQVETYSPLKTQVQSEAGTEMLDPGRWRALFVLLLAAVMDLLDGTVVNVAIPALQRDLGATYSAIQWITAGYTLSFALLLITGGRLGDIWGRKRMFMLGIVGFTLASAACGLAQSPEMLVGARILQGAMAAVMIPQVLSMIQVIFPQKERGAAFGMYGAVVGLAAVSGPLIGGALVQANLFNLDWRPIFLVNVPVGLAALVAATIFLRESKAEHALRLDLIGVLLVTFGLLLLLFPLVQGRDLGWPTWTFFSMAASLPVFALFVLYERYKTRVDGSPLVVLGLFRQRAFVAGSLVSLVFFCALIAFFLIFTLYLQIGLGFSALHAGLTGLPFSLCVAAASGASSQLGPKLGRKILSMGALLVTAGMSVIWATVHFVGTSITSWHLVPGLVICGGGMGLLVAPLADVVLSGVRGRDAGSASGILSTAQQVGAAIGVAVIGVIFFGLLTSGAGSSAEAVAPQVRSGLSAAGVPAPFQAQIVSSFNLCFRDRMAEQDPFVVPPSCQQAQASQGGAALPAGMGERIGGVLAPAADQARKLLFTGAFEQTLLYEIAAFLASFFLIFLLPTGVQETTPARDDFAMAS